MDEIVAALTGIEYPATRQQLIEAALAGSAPPEVVHRLEALTKERYQDVDELEWELHQSRAETNPSLVAITPEPCEECGFLKTPGKPHSCIEEKARFAETANDLTDEFETQDEGRGS